MSHRLQLAIASLAGGLFLAGCTGSTPALPEVESPPSAGATLRIKVCDTYSKDIVLKSGMELSGPQYSTNLLDCPAHDSATYQKLRSARDAIAGPLCEAIIREEPIPYAEAFNAYKALYPERARTTLDAGGSWIDRQLARDTLMQQSCRPFSTLTLTTDGAILR